MGPRGRRPTLLLFLTGGPSDPAAPLTTTAQRLGSSGGDVQTQRSGLLKEKNKSHEHEKVKASSEQLL